MVPPVDVSLQIEPLYPLCLLHYLLGMLPSVVLAGDVAVGVASLAVAGALSLVDFAGDVAVGVILPAVAGVASPAVAGVAPLADLAGVVTVGVAPLAIAGVASPAVAGVASLAVAGVAPMADAGVPGWQCCWRSDGLGCTGSGGDRWSDITAGVCSTLFHDSVCRDSEVDCCGGVSPNAWCQGMRDVRDDSVCEYVN